MLNNLFTGIFDTAGAAVISVPDFLLCIVVSLLIGAFITWVYTYKSRYTMSFAVTLAMLPAIVCIVIMMVNGNVGAGVAVARGKRVDAEYEKTDRKTDFPHGKTGVSLPHGRGRDKAGKSVIFTFGCSA